MNSKLSDDTGQLSVDSQTTSNCIKVDQSLMSSCLTVQANNPSTSCPAPRGNEAPSVGEHVRGSTVSNSVSRLRVLFATASMSSPVSRGGTVLSDNTINESTAMGSQQPRRLQCTSSTPISLLSSSQFYTALSPSLGHAERQYSGFIHSGRGTLGSVYPVPADKDTSIVMLPSHLSEDALWSELLVDKSRSSPTPDIQDSTAVMDLKAELVEKNNNLAMAAELGQLLVTKTEELEAELASKSTELDAAVHQYQEKFEMFEREKRSADQRQRRDCAAIVELEKELSAVKRSAEVDSDRLSHLQRRVDQLVRTPATSAGHIRSRVSVTGTPLVLNTNGVGHSSAPSFADPTVGHRRTAFSISAAMSATPRVINDVFPDIVADEPYGSVTKSLVMSVAASPVSPVIALSFIAPVKRHTSTRLRLFAARCSKRQRLQTTKIDVVQQKERSGTPHSASLHIDSSTGGGDQRVRFLEREYANLIVILGATRLELCDLQRQWQNRNTETISSVLTTAEVIEGTHSITRSCSNPIITAVPALALKPPSLFDEIDELKANPIEINLGRIDTSAAEQAHIEHFFLTVLSLKQTSCHMDILHSLSPMQLWTEALSLNIPFTEYHSWIERRLDSYYWDAVLHLQPTTVIASIQAQRNERFCELQSLNSRISHRRTELDTLLQSWRYLRTQLGLSGGSAEECLTSNSLISSETVPDIEVLPDQTTKQSHVHSHTQSGTFGLFDALGALLLPSPGATSKMKLIKSGHNSKSHLGNLAMIQDSCSTKLSINVPQPDGINRGYIPLLANTTTSDRVFSLFKSIF